MLVRRLPSEFRDYGFFSEIYDNSITLGNKSFDQSSIDLELKEAILRYAKPNKMGAFSKNLLFHKISATLQYVPFVSLNFIKTLFGLNLYYSVPNNYDIFNDSDDEVININLYRLQIAGPSILITQIY